MRLASHRDDTAAQSETQPMLPEPDLRLRHGFFRRPAASFASSSLIFMRSASISRLMALASVTLASHGSDEGGAAWELLHPTTPLDTTVLSRVSEAPNGARRWNMAQHKGGAHPFQCRRAEA